MLQNIMRRVKTAKSRHGTFCCKHTSTYAIKHCEDHASDNIWISHFWLATAMCIVPVNKFNIALWNDLMY